MPCRTKCLNQPYFSLYGDGLAGLPFFFAQTDRNPQLSGMLPPDAARFLDVTCAILSDGDGNILGAQRGPGMTNPGKWEFPGGKLEPFEEIEDCIRREILEELGVVIKVTGVGPSFVSVQESGRILRLYALFGEVVSGEMVLAEHMQVRWVAKENLEQLDWQAADIPVVDWLLACGGC